MEKYISGLILSLHPANERCRYKVTLSLIGWVQTSIESALHTHNKTQQSKDHNS